MFQPNPHSTPEEYISHVEEERKADIQALHDLIQKTLPSRKPYMESGMIGYGKFRYRSKSGREGDWALILLSNRKNYISLYVCAVTKDGKYIAELNKDRLGKVSVGKSCIRFKKLTDVDLAVLKEVLIEGEKAFEQFGYGV